MSDATFFILNGPKAGDQIPYSNAPQIRQEVGPGKWIDYEPAPVLIAPWCAPAVMLLGTKITFLPSGNACLAHPKWVRTLVHATKGDIREIEDDVIGAGT